MLVGYILIFTNIETLSLQQDALKQAGCERVIIDEVIGVQLEQPGLEKAFVLMRPGDTLVVWRLDRLGKSLRDVVQKVEELHRRRIGLRSLHEEINTTGPNGRSQLAAFSALAEFEHHLLQERTLAGLRAARARGRLGGRRREMSAEKVNLAARMITDPSITVQEICAELGISRSTLYRYVSPEGEVRSD